MMELPEDITTALAERPGIVRAYALEQALRYAMRASKAINEKSEQSPRAHVIGLAEVAQSWAALADALRITL